MERMDSFLEVVSGFKAVFLDSYGVIKNYRGLIEGVQETLDFIQARGIEFRILTNDASRSQEQQAESFIRQGLRGIPADKIITSGMMAKQYLQLKIKGGKVAYLGTANAAHYIMQANLESVAIADLDKHDLDDIKAMVFLDDEGFDWNFDINRTVNLIRKKNMPIIVANSDNLYPVSHNDVSIATGGIAKLVESIINKRFIHFGKPDTQMFNFAFEDINRYSEYNKEDILMVGDTLHTDILGGNKFGIKTALVLSGNTSATEMEMNIRSTGIIPDYICESIGG
ncbi:MAG: HAD-IIA family hydrolase [Haliscomenobacter sp.]|uniref:HAD-IIA family hydrolase n=1 Tax=Haliscomenobacter sp. TaxID=2717303 RepID=UPI0029A3DA36|nr:HAD-IIA family hydrolase [Haliscomenobacter sp.]MDX2069709.1 HAD-IIA family hydrolase [Haliscomenobacter sp.]